MEEDVELMRSKKQQLIDEQKELEIQYENIKLQYSALYRQVGLDLRQGFSLGSRDREENGQKPFFLVFTGLLGQYSQQAAVGVRSF